MMRMAPRARNGKHTSKTPIMVDEGDRDRKTRCAVSRRGNLEVGWILDDDVRTGRQGDIGGDGIWQNRDRAHGQEMMGGE